MPRASVTHELILALRIITTVACTVAEMDYLRGQQDCGAAEHRPTVVLDCYSRR
jgi:hypothetical protein